jgi:GTP1/Obg family GTP-binding protein
MTKKRRRAPRLLLSWSMRDQKRFIEAVERFQSLVNDLEKIHSALQRLPNLQTLLAVSDMAGPGNVGRECGKSLLTP